MSLYFVCGTDFCGHVGKIKLLGECNQTAKSVEFWVRQGKPWTPDLCPADGPLLHAKYKQYGFVWVRGEKRKRVVTPREVRGIVAEAAKRDFDRAFDAATGD